MGSFQISICSMYTTQSPSSLSFSSFLFLHVSIEQPTTAHHQRPYCVPGSLESDDEVCRQKQKQHQPHTNNTMPPEGGIHCPPPPMVLLCVWSYTIKFLPFRRRSSGLISEHLLYTQREPNRKVFPGNFPPADRFPATRFPAS